MSFEIFKSTTSNAFSDGCSSSNGSAACITGPVSSVDNSLVFFDGTTGLKLKENTNFKFITGETYGDQLKVPDIETDDHLSLNEELKDMDLAIQNNTTKLVNQTSVSTPNPITTLVGELDVAVIKSYQHNCELQFDDTDASLTADGTIRLTALNIDLNGVSTTNQTTFTQDQQIVSKKYVDDALLPDLSTLEDKTQNIDAGLTTDSLTSLTKAIEIRSGSSFDNQFNFHDTSNTREQAAVGFIAGSGSNGLKWVVGGAGDLNSVLFRTYALNDNILIETNDDPTLKINANGTIQLERTGVYDGTTDAILKLNTNGTLEKSNATVSTTGDLSTSGYVDATQFREGGYIGAIFRNPNTDNYFLGFEAGLSYNSGDSNLFIGKEAGSDCNDSSENIGIGYRALKFSQSSDNVAIGYQSQVGVSATTTGSYNISMGTATLYNITTGANNVAIGANAGYNITTGANNTCIGRDSGIGANMNNSTSLGYNARPDDGMNRTAIGYQSICDADNQVCLGDGSTTQIINTGNGVCDLGSTTHEFKDIHFSGDLIQDGSTLPPVRKIFKGSAGSTATVYEDDKVRFIWDGANKQPKYLIKVAPAGSWIDGGIQLTHEPLTQEFITEVDDLSIATNVEFYFTTSGSRNSAFDMTNYGNLATTWLIAETDATYPAYYCRWMTGSTLASLCVIVERN